MKETHFDLEGNVSVDNASETTKYQAADIWNLILYYEAKQAVVYQYDNGDIHVSILPKADEMYHFAFNFNDVQLLNYVSHIAEASDIRGKMHLSSSEDHRKLEFHFK